MSKVKVISFDLHETLATPDFVLSVWEEGVPALYAAKCGISLEKAKDDVFKEYKTVSDTMMEYYDLKYWSKRLSLGGYEAAIDYCKHKVAYYPETIPVLSELSQKYPLIIATGMPREFMPPILHDIEKYFTRIFSSFSDYNQFKTPEFYKTVCCEMGVLPEAMVHTGDNWQKDYVIPREIGVHTFHLDRKGKPSKTTITNLRELEASIENIERGV